MLLPNFKLAFRRARAWRRFQVRIKRIEALLMAAMICATQAISMLSDRPPLPVIHLSLDPIVMKRSFRLRDQLC